MTKNSNSKDEKKNKNILYGIIAILVVLVLFFAFNGSNDSSSTSLVNPDNNQDNSNLDNSNSQDNTNTASEDNIDGLKNVRFEIPTEIKLFDTKGVTAFVIYDTESEFKDSVKVTVESIDSNFKKSFTVPYSRTGSEISKMILLELNDKEDMNKEHEFIMYMDYKGDIILEKKFKVKVLPKYAFANDLKAEINYDELKLHVFPTNKLKIKINLKDDKNKIFEGFVYGIDNNGISNTPINSLVEYNATLNKRVPITLINPTIDIYDEDRELYIVRDLSVEIK